MRNVTLRIKRVYFDQILAGTKHVEYRDVKPFYVRLLRDADQISTLTLHYQRGRTLRARVTGIKRIPTPEFFKFDHAGIEFGPETFAIMLADARLISS